jgi:hypothetical protein
MSQTSDDLDLLIKNLPPEGQEVIKSGKALEFFVMLGVSFAKQEGASDASILERVRKEALSALAERA